jgi:salicylate hydroxylase
LSHRESRPVVITGAGIAGLTAAIAFAARGLPVHVFEKANKIEEIGAGIQLSPNATRILDRLGMLDALRTVAVLPEAVVLRRARDLAELARVPLGKGALERWGAPYLVLHRADLQAMLLARAARQPGVSITTAAEVTGASAGVEGVTVSYQQDATARTVEAPLLVGADGVWSRTRTFVVGGAESRFTGRIAWRATLRAGSPAFATLGGAVGTREVTAFLHPSAHLVTYPVRAGAAINLVAFTKGADLSHDWESNPDRSSLEAAFATSALGVLVRGAQWTSYPIHQVKPGQSWTGNGLALIGDAAHAMPPFAAQGAAMAIEDAWTLAEEVGRDQGDNPVALARYEARRKPRVIRVARRGAFNEFTWHAAGPVAMARDLVLRTRRTQRLATDMDWLYGFDAAVKG